MTDRIARGLAALGLDPARADTLARYGQLLLAGNQVMNLTAITDPVEVAEKHMLDCAALLTLAPLAGKRVLDVGTGAGFPGLALLAAEPALDMTLLDSLQKRVLWLEDTARALDLAPRCIHGRAEELGRDPAFRSQFDLVTARAVADLRLLCELCLPFVRVGGEFWAMKSADCEAELSAARAAIETLGGGDAVIQEYTVPGTDLHHAVVRIRKTAPTPERYPRRFAKMQKAPL